MQSAQRGFVSFVLINEQAVCAAGDILYPVITMCGLHKWESNMKKLWNNFVKIMEKETAVSAESNNLAVLVRYLSCISILH